MIGMLFEKKGGKNHSHLHDAMRVNENTDKTTASHANTPAYATGLIDK